MTAIKHNRPLPRVIAVANQKGGVGKTTTSINLGSCLAEMGYRTLIVDFDPQGSATSGVGVDSKAVKVSMYNVIAEDATMEECIEATESLNLFIAPARENLADATLRLVSEIARETRLKDALEPVLDLYDFIFIDCPPSASLLTINALVAAKEVLVPMQCEYFALEGIAQLNGLVKDVVRTLNPDLEISTIVLVMFDSKTNLSQLVANDIKKFFGDKVCKTVIPRNVRLAEAQSRSLPINLYAPTSKGGEAYRELAEEVASGTSPRTR